MEEFDVFFDDENEVVNPVLIYAKSGTKKYISKDLLDDDNNIDGFKAIISAADGASGNIGESSARITGRPFVGLSNSGYNQTFIGFGNFNTLQEAETLVKYMKTKFVRFLVGTLKATNGTKFNVWANVPLQDFIANSDIDWTKAIADIDKQLYAKYGLSDEEIDFIESKVRAMD